MTELFVPRVHAMADSGNCYKPCLLMDLLGRPYEWVAVDALAGETRGPAFLEKNPAGRVPMLEYAPGAYLPESNAILFFLARDSRFWPVDPAEQAAVLGWMFWEQNSHEVWIATSRFGLMFGGETAQSEETLRRREPGLKALRRMEEHLGAHAWFGATAISLADIALFAYTHVADEGGFALDDFPAIREWLDRVAAQPGFKPMRRGT